MKAPLFRYVGPLSGLPVAIQAAAERARRTDTSCLLGMLGLLLVMAATR